MGGLRESCAVILLRSCFDLLFVLPKRSVLPRLSQWILPFRTRHQQEEILSVNLIHNSVRNFFFSIRPTSRGLNDGDLIQYYPILSALYIIYHNVVGWRRIFILGMFLARRPRSLDRRWKLISTIYYPLFLFSSAAYNTYHYFFHQLLSLLSIRLFCWVNISTSKHPHTRHQTFHNICIYDPTGSHLYITKFFRIANTVGDMPRHILMACRFFVFFISTSSSRNDFKVRYCTVLHQWLLDILSLVLRPFFFFFNPPIGFFFLHYLKTRRFSISRAHVPDFTRRASSKENVESSQCDDWMTFNSKSS